jgi:hypothetical protein
MGMVIDKMSASRLRTFYTCGARYFFRYVEDLVIAPTSALMIGDSFHSSIGHNYRQKIKSHRNLKLQEVLDVFSTEFDERSHETRWKPTDDRAKLKDLGIGALSAYQCDIADAVQPSAVEYEFKIPMLQGGELLPWFFEGHIDVVTAEMLREAKTTASTPPRPLAHDKLQVTAYAAGQRVETGKPEIDVALDYAVKTKTPKAVSFLDTIGDHDMKLFMYMLNQAVRLIDDGVFIPNRACLTCTDYNCGYWDLCHRKVWRVNDGQREEGDSDIGT